MISEHRPITRWTVVVWDCPACGWRYPTLRLERLIRTRLNHYGQPHASVVPSPGFDDELTAVSIEESESVIWWHGLADLLQDVADACWSMGHNTEDADFTRACQAAEYVALRLIEERRNPKR